MVYVKTNYINVFAQCPYVSMQSARTSPHKASVCLRTKRPYVFAQSVRYFCPPLAKIALCPQILVKTQNTKLRKKFVQWE
jgi:hypothetical protein